MSKPKATHESTAQKPAETAQKPAETAQKPGEMARRPSREGSQLAGRRQQQELSPWAYSSPFSFMRRFGEEMDRLFDDFGLGGLGPRLGSELTAGGALGRAAAWSPQVEMFERGDKLVVRADLPGLRKEDVSVDVDDGALTIQGERRQEHEENREGYYRSERSYGSFYRSIPLPPGVDAEDAKASFRDGVLEIEMAAPKKARGRRIDIEGAAGK